eukprot:SAG31_NODE_31828_length_363_cov_1.181818_1_plen_51_part_01
MLQLLLAMAAPLGLPPPPPPPPPQYYYCDPDGGERGACLQVRRMAGTLAPS